METLEDDLLAETHRQGFILAGIAQATDADDFDRYLNWLDQGYAGEMKYLHDHAEARRSPASVFPPVRSVLMVAMSYAPDEPPSTAVRSPNTGRIALYAQAPDYHAVVRDRLKQVGHWLKHRRPESWGRVAVDTAPLLERGFARRAGLGWIGKNTMLIHPRVGSFIVLGAMLLNIDLRPSAPFDSFHCGTCSACLDECPTSAFVASGVLDARRCISYHTIEQKGPLEEPWRDSLDDWLFGCDICQSVCPWTRKAARFPHSSSTPSPLAPRPEFALLNACELLGLDPDAFRLRFQGTALYPRPGRPVLLRNAAIVLGNTGDADALPALQHATLDPEPLIRETATWAITKIEQRLASLLPRGSP